MTGDYGTRVLLAAGALVVLSHPVSAQYQEVAVSNGGAIHGHVRVIGDVPKLPPQPVFKEHETCGTTTTDERLLVGTNGDLRNAVAYLENIHAGKAVPRTQAVTLYNRKCAFVPHVLSASVGQTLEIHNDDPFLHDAHALLGSRTVFNVAIPKGHTVHRLLADPGLIYINCNVRHTWMHAYLFVADHPYHSVSDESGRFAIDNVPPGTYTLSVWHELLGSVDRQVTVEAGKTTTLDVELQAAATETP